MPKDVITNGVLGLSWADLFDNAADICSKDVGEMGFNEEPEVSAVGIVGKNWCQCQRDRG